MWIGQSAVVLIILLTGRAKGQSCSLCPDGSTPEFNETTTGSTTCTDLVAQVSVLSNSSDACLQVQTSSADCGCNVCTLCAGGEEFQGDGIFGTPAANEQVFRCSDIAAMIIASETSSETCTYHQAAAALYCGCTSVPEYYAGAPDCTLCPGNANPSVPGAIVPGADNMTCATFQKLVPNLFTASSCFMVEEATKAACGCPAPATCTLCLNNATVVDPTVVIQASSGQNLTCGKLEETAGYLKAGASLAEFESTCRAFRAEYTIPCCPATLVSTPTMPTPLTTSPVAAPSTSGGVRIVGVWFSGLALLFI
jgi:hypothetical protein